MTDTDNLDLAGMRDECLAIRRAANRMINLIDGLAAHGGEVDHGAIKASVKKRAVWFLENYGDMKNSIMANKLRVDAEYLRDIMSDLENEGLVHSIIGDRVYRGQKVITWSIKK